MARTTSTNFTGGLDFTVATAGTDLFVKDDVQVLAQAVDLHNHDAASGKGLAVAGAAAGSITTAMIAPNAVQELIGQFGGGVTFSTTTTGAYVATPMTVSFTSSGGLLRLEATATLSHSVASGNFYLGIGLDGSPPILLTSLGQSAVANAYVTLSIIVYAAGVAAGAHSATAHVYNATPGTLTIFSGTTSVLYVTEQKR